VNKFSPIPPATTEAEAIASPEFAHAVPAQPTSGRFRTYSVIFYGGRSRHGFDLPSQEFNYLCRDDAHAVSRCRFEAAYQKRTHCKVRNPLGEVIYDGRSELAMEIAA
jgi:hypothetical protein